MYSLERAARYIGKRVGLLLCVGFIASPAQAAFITYVFEAPIFTVGFQPGSPTAPPLPGTPFTPPVSSLQLPPELSNPFDVIGQNISGFVTVNDVATDFNPDPTRGSYGGFNVLPLFSATLLGNTFALDRTKPGTLSTVSVLNQDTPQTSGIPASNFLQLRSNLGTGLFMTAPASTYVVNLSLNFFTQDLNIINSDALPQDLTLFPNYLLSLSILDPVSRDVMDFQASVSLRRFVPPSAAPEPSALAVFGLGLLLLLAGRRCVKAIGTQHDPRSAASGDGDSLEA
jgi:hypothetical protein